MSRKALGRGLEALIPEAPPRPAGDPATGAVEGDTTREVAIDEVRSNPYQPRGSFDADALQELADSIRENGLIQPLVVRPVPGGGYELIAGERRFRACAQAGLTRVPVVIRKASPREMLQIALVENLQREDLNAIEEAEAFQRLATEFGLTQEEIAGRVGKSRTAVTNALRLLTLSPKIRDQVSRGTLSAGHARAILALPHEKDRLRLAALIVEKGLSVRQAEAMVQGRRGAAPRAQPRKRSHPALDAWEDRLRTRFATHVRIVGGLARGKVEIQYFNEDDLERILEIAGVAADL